MAQGSALLCNRDFQCSFATASLTDARRGRSKIWAALNHLKVNFSSVASDDVSMKLLSIKFIENGHPCAKRCTRDNPFRAPWT